LAAGQQALLSFSGTQGEEVSLVGSTNITACATIAIQAPTGATVSSSSLCGTGFLDAQPLPASGSYHVSISAGSTGQVTVQLFNAAVVTGSLTIDGPSLTETLLPGQDALLTFTERCINR
jgi:hypothetical protein